MSGKRAGLVLTLLGMAGCAGAPQALLSDRRPPTTPAPLDVETEIRDARYFLAYPETSVAPDTTFHSRDARTPASSN